MVNPAIQGPRYLAPGDKLGKYELIRQIAVGGMAELYLGRTVGIEGFEKLAVLKRILPQYAKNASFVNMFLSEARLAATLHHPNIAQVYDIGGDGGDFFFSMEYIHGEDLGRLIATALDGGVPLSLDTALTFACGLCAGLHYAHEKVGSDGRPLNVVHRDVSPSNVLVSYDGAVKVVDFGIARVSSSHNPEKTNGGLKGKIAYMSPEQCRGKVALDRRSDIFSVGSILFEMTTGQRPFTDETEYGILNQIVNTDAPKPSSLVPSYPPALEKIVMKAMARDVAVRYATSLALQTDLEDFAHENRLRMSALVLARLMSNLFPARLEEWQHAKAQGAFFVEQHVVRTLIESGKTSDSAPKYVAPAETERTDTSIGPPIDEKQTDVKLALPAPRPSPMPSRSRASAPIPGAVPIQPMQPGTLYSSGALDAVAPIPEVHDLTQRVQALPAPQQTADPTTMVPFRRRSRLPEVILGSTAALAVAIVIYIATRSTDKPAPSSPAAVVETPATAPRPPATAPPPPAIETPVASLPVEPPVAPAPVEPPAAKAIAPPPTPPVAEETKPAPEIEMSPIAPVAKVKKPIAKKVAPAPTKSVAPAPTKPVASAPAKPVVKKPPVKKTGEDKPWNDDSPFMPVRTDKQ